MDFLKISTKVFNYEKKIASLFFVCFCFINGFSQEEKGNEEKFTPHSSLGIILGHAHVNKGKNAEGDKTVLSLPSWGIDYNYHFHPRWAIGLHTDIILEKFIVENEHGEELERSYPVSPALMGIYKAGKHWNFLMGAGMEFEKERNFFLNRLGVEYGAELPKRWEVAGSLTYDLKWNGYDTWVIGFGIIKAFGSHNTNDKAKHN